MYPCACAPAPRGHVRVVGEHGPGSVPGGREVPRVVREDRRIEVHEPDGVAVDDARPRLGWGGIRRVGRVAETPASESMQLALGVSSVRALFAGVTLPLSVRYFGNVSSIGVSTERRPVIGPRGVGVVPSEHRCKRGVPAGATVWGSVGHSSGSASFGATGGVTKNLLCLTQLRQITF